VSEPDLDKIAEASQSILAMAQFEDVTTTGMATIEARLQTIWAEVNEDVDSVEDMEAIYPDD